MKRKFLIFLLCGCCLETASAQSLGTEPSKSPSSVSELFSLTNLFHADFTNIVHALVLCSREQFKGELLIGKDSIKGKGDDIQAGLVWSVMFFEVLHAAGKTRNQGPPVSFDPDGPHVCVIKWTGKVFMEGTTLITIKRRLGPPDAERVLDWARYELGDSGSISSSGKPETVSTYLGGLIGFSDSSVWIDWPRFLKAMGREKKDTGK